MTLNHSAATYVAVSCPLKNFCSQRNTFDWLVDLLTDIVSPELNHSSVGTATAQMGPSQLQNAAAGAPSPIKLSGQQYACFNNQ
jgi:hypothetical protein